MKKVLTGIPFQHAGGGQLSSGTYLTHVISIAFVVALAMMASSCAQLRPPLEIKGMLDIENIELKTLKMAELDCIKTTSSTASKTILKDRALEAKNCAEKVQNKYIWHMALADAEWRRGILWRQKALTDGAQVVAVWKTLVWQAKENAIEWKIAAQKAKQIAIKLKGAQEQVWTAKKAQQDAKNEEEQKEEQGKEKRAKKQGKIWKDELCEVIKRKEEQGKEKRAEEIWEEALCGEKGQKRTSTAGASELEVMEAATLAVEVLTLEVMEATSLTTTQAEILMEAKERLEGIHKKTGEFFRGWSWSAILPPVITGYASYRVGKKNN